MYQWLVSLWTRNWIGPSPLFSASLGTVKSVKLQMRNLQSLLKVNQKKKGNFAILPFMRSMNYQLSKFWTKQEMHYIFSTCHKKKIIDLFMKFTMIQHHPRRWFKAILVVQKQNKTFGNSIQCFMTVAMTGKLVFY